VPHEEIVFECAGINHIAWMTRLEVGDEDAYPRLFEAMKDPGIYTREKVHFELMRRFGYFVTESSEHNAEYTPYFLRDDELIERFDVPARSIRRCRTSPSAPPSKGSGSTHGSCGSFGRVCGPCSGRADKR
jgi:alpha-galactosidase/6-phospho-beta-glucosidase family protein